MLTAKPKLSFWQIINMNLGFFGIQYSFGLQQSAVNPIYDFLGASPDQIPILNLAGPLTGLIIQPIIGTLSDKTWSARWGRRKPYFFIGAILCSIALFFFPFSSALWMAVGLLWILDIGNNTAMEPYRAFVADKLDKSQQATGFQAQSFFTGLGQTLANFSLLAFPLIFIGKTGKLPTWVFASFFLGAVCSVATVWWSMKTTPEIPPTETEIKEIEEYNRNKPHPFVQIVTVLLVIAAGPVAVYFLLRNVMNTELLSLLLLPICLTWAVLLFTLIKNPDSKNPVVKMLQGVLSPFVEIVHAIQSMPKIMWMLAVVYLFQWYALFCYWQNSAKAVAENAYGWHYKELDKDEESLMKKYASFKKEVTAYAQKNDISEKEINKNYPTVISLYTAFKDKVTNDFSQVDIDAIAPVEANNSKYEQAVSATGGINGWYNIVTFLVAFLLVGFAKRFGMEASALVVQDDAIYARKVEAGRPTAEVLAGALPAALGKISFEKTMRWNASNVAFSRAINWIVALLGESVIPFEFAGVQTGNESTGVRGRQSLRTLDQKIRRTAVMTRTREANG